MKTKYDVVILGAGHNGLVAAAIWRGAGLSVLLLEKNDYIGGATTSQKVFPGLRRASVALFLPGQSVPGENHSRSWIESRTAPTRDGRSRLIVKNGRHDGLLLSNVSEETSRQSMFELTGSQAEFEQMKKFYGLSRVFAENVWDTMLEPLVAKEEFRRRFDADDASREAWRSLVEEPLGRAVERYLQNDLVRGLVFTDAKIGVFTHPHDPTLLQNRCFLYHLIGNKTGEWKVPVGGMGGVAGELEQAARKSGAEMLTDVQLRALDVTGKKRSVEFDVDGKTHTSRRDFFW